MNNPPPPPQALPAPPPPKRRGWIWIVLLLLLGGGAAWYFLHGSDAPAKRRRHKMSAETPSVVGMKVTKGDVHVYQNGLGAVTPLYTVTVRSRVDGQLMKIFYTEGQSVKEGDPLAEIDTRPYQAALDQAKGQLERDKALLANAKVDLERYKTLWAQDSIPQQTLATQQATVAQDVATIASDEAAVETAQLNLTYCHIIAPITGRVGLRLVDPGNMVHSSDTSGLLVITQVQPITVIFPLAEDVLPPILRRFNAHEKLVVDAFDREMRRKLAQGSLLSIDNQIDTTTGTLKLRALFPNEDNALFPNQFVNARLLVEQHAGATLAPTAAVQRGPQGLFVYLAQPDGTVTLRPVKTGVTEGENVEVLDGLSPGDTVVTEGVDQLKDGGKVNLQLK
ncbi:MAG: MdtA/MuxA family multidrug efflux RND transporter periplasmic adaptor subunit [Verrucomicrobium sp.]|nr:MdtA/MuxA family multidrug efflux RND transporter periplasmic adaptor subunit [Verrucomicrobium sp.]